MRIIYSRTTFNTTQVQWVLINLVAYLFLKNNIANYRETCSIFPNLHHMIDMIPSFKMLDIII